MIEIDKDKLSFAGDEEIEWTLAHSLRFEKEKRNHDEDGLIARLVAQRLIEKLKLNGYVIMKR